MRCMSVSLCLIAVELRLGVVAVLRMLAVKTRIDVRELDLATRVRPETSCRNSLLGPPAVRPVSRKGWCADAPCRVSRAAMTRSRRSLANSSTTIQTGSRSRPRDRRARTASAPGCRSRRSATATICVATIAPGTAARSDRAARTPNVACARRTEADGRRPRAAGTSWSAGCACRAGSCAMRAGSPIHSQADQQQAEGSRRATSRPISDGEHEDRCMSQRTGFGAAGTLS